MRTRTFIVVGPAVYARTNTTTRHLVFRRACLWTGFMAFATIAFGLQQARAAVTEAWVQRYGSEAGSEDAASKVVTDAADNVIVAGTTWRTQTGSGSDMLIIKYSGAGVPLWTNRYDEPGNSRDVANAVALDASGNVFVTGYSEGGGSSAYATIAYSGAGVPLWTNRYDGPYAQATAVAVDGSGNVFVTGHSITFGSGNIDYVTIKYSGTGVPLWTNRYNGPANSSDFASALAVDGSGNVFVTGLSDSASPGFGPSYDYATVAYSGAGVRLWTKRYNGPVNGDDYANAVAVDASGNVFVTGWSYGSESTLGYLTIGYSGAGVPLWTNRYNGPGNSSDQAVAVAVDRSSNVFVTGTSATIAYSSAGAPLWTNSVSGTAIALGGSGSVFVAGDGLTIAYTGAGVPLWTNRYNGSLAGISLDGSGNVFVTGSSAGSVGNSDYATIAYSGAGVALWTNRYGGRGETSDIANAVAVDAGGHVFVAGSSASSFIGADYVTIAYSDAGAALWTNRYSGPANGDDQATAVAVDASGNVFVTGSSASVFSGAAYATIAYSGAGVPLWTNRYSGTTYGDDQATAMAVDARGNVFVTGSSASVFSEADYATIAYSGAGVPLWTNRYNGPENGLDEASAVAVDRSGNVFVTGRSAGSGGGDFSSAYVTIAYSGAGVPLWTNRYHGPENLSDQANAVAVDASGNVVVTGTSGFPMGFQYATTIAYSGAGVPLWTNRYHGTATAVAVDASSNVFVTGSSGGEYVTIAYSGAGVPLWTNRYHGTANSANFARAVAVDSNGNVIVTGSSDSDYATIGYSGAGVPLWTNRYNGPGNGEEWTHAKSLAIGSDGAVYVTGASDGLFSSDFATVKYVWQTEIAIQLLSTIPPKVNLTLSGAPNSSWAIEHALELTGPWTYLSTLLVGPNGSAQFQDTNSPNSAGFYRARQQ
jgi:hypothetical protein